MRLPQRPGIDRQVCHHSYCRAAFWSTPSTEYPARPKRAAQAAPMPEAAPIQGNRRPQAAWRALRTSSALSAWAPMESPVWITSRSVRSVSITKVIRLEREEVWTTLGAELRGHRAVGVREREAERLLLVELLLLVDRVGTDADLLGAHGGARRRVPEVATLLGAAMHGGRVEERGRCRSRSACSGTLIEPIRSRGRCHLFHGPNVGDEVPGCSRPLTGPRHALTEVAGLADQMIFRRSRLIWVSSVRVSVSSWSHHSRSMQSRD